MVTEVSNYGGNITKTYALGEVDTRFPVITDIVPADNTTAFTKGQVLIYDAANNEYVLGEGDDVITNVVVALEDKAETATRVNVLITGLVCVATASILVERDACKLAAAGKVTKWVSAEDDLNIQAPIIFMKQAGKINEGLGKAVTNATATGEGSKVLVWVNSPLSRAINEAAPEGGGG